MPALKNSIADLRSKYNRYLKISLILSLSFLILAFKLSPEASKQKIIVEPTEPPIKLTDIPETVQKPKLPPSPLNPDPIDPSNNDIEDIKFEETVWNENDPLPDLPLPPTPDIPEEIEIFVWSEVMPEPVGGLATIQNKVRYTEIAKRIGLEGSVYIQAIIDEKGNVIHSEVLKGIGGSLDEEALNAVSNTKFHPGLQRGKPVKVKMIIPIKFVLK